MPDINGIPSVTTILAATGLGGDYSQIRDRDRALALGSAFHRIVELDALGTLDPESIHPSLRVKYNNYKDLQETYCYEPQYPELELISTSNEWCGHLDAVGTFGGTGPVVVDLKGWGADLVAAAIQLSAYRLLWDEHHPDTPSTVGVILRVGSTVGQHQFLLEERLPLHPQTAREAWLGALALYYAQELA